MITILVADDHPIVCDGLTAVLSTQPDFAVVGAAYNGAQAVERTAELRPDILLLDLAMPDLSGVEVLRQLAERGVATHAIVFTAYDSDERIVSAVRAGARGYLLKGTPREELFRAIRVVHAGGSLLEPLVATKLLRQVSQPAPLGGALTPRERDVLDLLAQGNPNKTIARALGISERTVKFHVTAIMHKLGAENRTEAVTLAAQRGLIQLAR
ncbi:MAG TPA: response regulator transcription factor [Ktedonobacterales bacterium]|nr:response regulator transcription factor [Ktedonobacterales bacterium]